MGARCLSDVGLQAHILLAGVCCTGGTWNNTLGPPPLRVGSAGLQSCRSHWTAPAWAKAWAESSTRPLRQLAPCVEPRCLRGQLGMCGHPGHIPQLLPPRRRRDKDRSERELDAFDGARKT